MDSILKDDDLDDCPNSPTILFLIPRLHLKPIKIENIIYQKFDKKTETNFQIHFLLQYILASFVKFPTAHCK